LPFFLFSIILVVDKSNVMKVELGQLVNDSIIDERPFSTFDTWFDIYDDIIIDYYTPDFSISDDSRLPIIDRTPVIRENRLYPADWLMRFYGFKVEEIVDDAHPDLDLEMDPKSAYALRNLHLFPIDFNTADYHELLRIPGVGVKSARKMIAGRRFSKLREEHLKKIGVIWKRAQFFISCAGMKKKLLTQPVQLISNSLKPVFVCYFVLQLKSTYICGYFISTTNLVERS
jgi:predicted DNA-binding helix-hairpin-helix protein